jgi:hypothetical protein
MPTLKSPAASVDTAAPGLTRRRVWQAPRVRSHALIALTFSRMYLAPANFAVSPGAVDAIQDGADLNAAFDLESNTLTIEDRPTVTTRSGSIPTGQVVIHFDTYEAADEVFTKLWRRIAVRVKLHQNRPPLFDRVRTPLAAVGGVLLATLGLTVACVAVSDGGHPASGGFAPDWRWACGLGGAITAALQVWVYRRWTTPPTKLELRPID